jgi:hypothetical protein
MFHHRQRLPLGLKAGDELPRVHSQFDQLDGDEPADGLLLLGLVYDRHPPFADGLEDLVWADPIRVWLDDTLRRGVEDLRRAVSARQQLLQLAAQFRFSHAGGIEERAPTRGGQRHRLGEDVRQTIMIEPAHDRSLPNRCRNRRSRQSFSLLHCAVQPCSRHAPVTMYR